MQMVKHKIFGIGEVISKEVKENSTYITVRFGNGKEMKCAIPESFTIGIIVAEGSLKDEVDAAIAEKKAREQAKAEEHRALSAVVTANTPSNRRGRRPASPVAVKGAMELAFEEYLINAGYKEETDSGNPSTVFSYTNAIRVLEEEELNWHSLQNNIDNIVPIYDIGGVKQRIGAKSNSTVINALKRFREFVNG